MFVNYFVQMIEISNALFAIVLKKNLSPLLPRLRQVTSRRSFLGTAIVFSVQSKAETENKSKTKQFKNRDVLVAERSKALH